MVSPLDIKLTRDLWRMKGQSIAIGLVIGLGVMMLVMMDGLVHSLDTTRAAYYERYRLADVYAPVVRAPRTVLADLAKIEGVNAVEGRVTGGALIDMPDTPAPIRAEVVSLPEDGRPRLNDILITSGGPIPNGARDQILLIDDFAKAHGLTPGDTIKVTLNGAQRTLTIAGLARGPEFLYTAAPGELIPDDSRFAVIWMDEDALASAYDLKGAFSEALMSLSPEASLPAVLQAADRILEPFGATGAYGLKDQFSNRFITEEINGLRTSRAAVPPIFLAVAAFLLNIVISRMIDAERTQIGLMKAFGYTSAEVSAHYLKFILVVATGGALAGCGLGWLSGRALSGLYMQYYKFPFLIFEVNPPAFVIGVVASVLAASAGGLFVLRRLFSLTAAEAMRPPAPANYARSLNIGPFLKRVLDQPSRMVARRLTRQPARFALAVIGIAGGMALSVAMMTILASFDTVLDTNFSVIDRSDVTVTYFLPRSDTTLNEIKAQDGVIEAEPYRMVSAILKNGRESYRGGISGLVSEPRLNRAIDKDNQSIYIRDDGIILGQALADILKVKAGDKITVDVREGRHPQLEIPVVAVASTTIGAPAYMELNALNRALKEPHRISGAYLRIDSDKSGAIYKALKNMPAVAGVSLRADARAAFEKTMNEGAGQIRFVMAAIAAVITFGIVYNSARIAFAERERDLASLRVIGLTRGETAFVLLGELAVITVAALPLGCLAGFGFAFAMGRGFSTDLYQVPIAFTPSSYGQAIIAVVVAAVLSGWIVKRDIDRIDIVSALKARE